MTSTLKFRVETETVTEEARSDVPFTLVHVIPLIDGEPYIAPYKNYPFEALSVYAMDLKDGDVWAFNCECGTPACARINEPMKLTVDSSSVYWKLPDEPFIELAIRADGTPKPRELIFDRTHYTVAFDNLISELKSLEKVSGKLNIHPIFHRRPTLDEEIEIDRNWAAYRRIRRSALGDMDHEDAEFVVTTEDGLELTTLLSQIVYKVTRKFLSAGMYDLPKTREALNRLGQDLRCDPGKLLKQLDVHELSASLRAVGPTFTAEDEDVSRDPVPYWTGPDSPQEQIDYWTRLKQTGKVSIRKRQ